MARAGTDVSVALNARVISGIAEQTKPQPLPTRRSFRNITEQRFTLLTALEYVGIRGRIAAWKCRCDCDNYCIVTSNALLSGNKRMCDACARDRLRDGRAKLAVVIAAERLPNLYQGAVAKPCCECKLVKLVGEFSQRRKEPDGLSRQCRDCVKLRTARWTDNNRQHVQDTNREASRRYSEQYPERRIDARIRCKYGIGLREYESLLAKQNGGCAICGSPPTARPFSDREALCIDHDHATGVVRGLLCRQCNQGIGLFSDNTRLLENAIAYLSASRDSGSAPDGGKSFAVDNKRVLDGRMV